MGAGRELFARRRDGSEIPVEIGLNPVNSPEGRLVLTVIVDISARKLAESETRRHREELAHLSRVALLGELAGTLAHELNQPLTAIVNNASAGRRFIAKGRGDTAKFDELFSLVVEDGRRAGEIIHSIRAMVRKGEPERVPLNLNDVLAATVRLARADTAGRHCEIVTETEVALPRVAGDAVQLQQVLLNLILNGLDAMDTAPGTQRRLVLRTEKAGGRSVRTSVRDFGAGLPAETPERVFEQFYTTKRDGLGLGLAIARSIITSHGGELTGANAEGGGAQFSFVLPIIEEEAP
jgi:two-component system sensor kinase FixL